MIYFLLFGIGLALLLKRNPLTIPFQIHLRVPYLIILSFLLQVALAVVAAKTQQQFPVVLNLTFVGIIISLLWNRQLAGVKWILAGVVLNLMALLLHGGMMPVSETAMRIADLEDVGFAADSRHQLMGTTWFWWLGDWIPLLTPLGSNYVISLGDLLAGVGFILFIVRNSGARGNK